MYVLSLLQKNLFFIEFYCSLILFNYEKVLESGSCSNLKNWNRNIKLSAYCILYIKDKKEIRKNLIKMRVYLLVDRRFLNPQFILDKMSRLFDCNEIPVATT